MVINLLLLLSIGFHLISVGAAIYLSKITKKKHAWILISVGLIFESIRRILMFLNRYFQSSFLSSPLLTPITSILYSFLIFLGILMVIPVIKSIKESELRYHSIFDASGVSLWEEEHYEVYMLLEELKKTGVTNLRDYITEHPDFVEKAIKYVKIVDVNQATLELFKSANKKDFLEHWRSTITPLSKVVFIDNLITIFNGRNIFESETQYKDLEGKLLNAIIKIVDPVEKEYGKTSIISITNITDRVLAEKKLLTVLEEKNILLKELHHRTKNNMQVIIAMLSLRTYNNKNENVSTAFIDMINRIQSMSLVHEKLYKSENLSVIRLDEYIEDLMSFIINTKMLYNAKINLVLDLDLVSVDIDRAIPFGLIINELISNTFKHAFKGINAGEVKISLRNLKGEKVELIVADNGNGLPSGFDVHKCDTLGLQMVFALGEDQLHGSVDIVPLSNEKGVTWRLVINNQAKAARI